MATEYYFSKQLTLKHLKKMTKGLTITYHKEAKMAIIKDKYDNYLQAFGLNTKHDAIAFFNAKEMSGGEFIVHDIALQTQCVFISDSSYIDLCDLLEGVGKKDFTWLDVYSLPFIKSDLSECGLRLMRGKQTNKLYIQEVEHSTCEEDRAANKIKRDRAIREEMARDYNALARQIEKMNRTNISFSSIIADLDTELVESKTPKQTYA